MFFFFFQAEDGIRDLYVTGVQTCALPISCEIPLLELDVHVVAAALPRELQRVRRDIRGQHEVTSSRELRGEHADRAPGLERSEERRVGKEGRCRWSRCDW